MSWNTPLKFNMEPKNNGFQAGISYSRVPRSGEPFVTLRSHEISKSILQKGQQGSIYYQSKQCNCKGNPSTIPYIILFASFDRLSNNRYLNDPCVKPPSGWNAFFDILSKWENLITPDQRITKNTSKSFLCINLYLVGGWTNSSERGVSEIGTFSW